MLCRVVSQISLQRLVVKFWETCVMDSGHNLHHNLTQKHAQVSCLSMSYISRMGRSCLPSLAARPGADRLQGRCAEVQSFTRKCAAVSGTTRSCCRSARPTDTTLWWRLSTVQQSVTGRSRLLDPVSGTLCRRR